MILQANWKHLLSLVPESPEQKIDWDGLERTELRELFEQMAETPQNPVWHGEGDVWTHTKMVCEELIKMPAFWQQERNHQQEVFLACLLHDIGKIPCTRMEDGNWTSPNHTSTGAKLVREWLWTVYGLSGTKEMQNIRETICFLIRYHSVPLHILEQSNPERKIWKIASNGELAADFSMERLCMLEEADVRGRISSTKQESLDMVHLCAEMAEEAGCLKGVGTFSSSFSRHAYFSGKNILPEQELYNDTWGEVILLSGLPGTGKDTWIMQNHPDLPVVSLDALRRNMGVSPKENQGAVAQAAQELAKGYLRNHQSFIWNATNLTPQMRGKLVGLFQRYEASVRIVFLETGYEEGLCRNRSRGGKAEVPESVVRKMLKNLVLPERFEAQEVEWHGI